jgi:LmbE family N-acetylglucosaminyl deacetylase
VKILAFHAHPDDAEILAGGTLLLLAAQGHEITIATMTPGDCTSAEYGPDEIAAIRRKEAALAAQLIGARYLCAEFRDLAVFNDEPSRRRVTEILRRVKPELVLAASPVDSSCDHETAGALVRDCAPAAATPNYRTGVPNPAAPLPALPRVYFMDPAGGRDRSGAVVTPDFIVDVSSTFLRKQRAVAQHRSQREWLAQHQGIEDFLSQMECWTRQRGALAEVEYGEGFCGDKRYRHPQAPLLEQLLGEEFVRAVAQ